MIFDNMIIGLVHDLTRKFFNNFTSLATGILHRTIYLPKLVYICTITTNLFSVNNFCYFFVTIILDSSPNIAPINPFYHYFNSKFVHHYNGIFSDTKKPLVREATDYSKIFPNSTSTRFSLTLISVTASRDL